MEKYFEAESYYEDRYNRFTVDECRRTDAFFDLVFRRKRDTHKAFL